jgi:hypothetical protein
MAKKYVEVIFRDTHENQEWTCGYCKQVATTIRHGVAVCALHKHLWMVGVEPAPKTGDGRPASATSDDLPLPLPLSEAH